MTSLYTCSQLSHGQAESRISHGAQIFVARIERAPWNEKCCRLHRWDTEHRSLKFLLMPFARTSLDASFPHVVNFFPLGNESTISTGLTLSKDQLQPLDLAFTLIQKSYTSVGEQDILSSNFEAKQFTQNSIACAKGHGEDPV